MQLPLLEAGYLTWAACLLALAMFVYGLHPVARWRLRRLPGPPFRWLVGHLPEMVRLGQETAYAEWGKRYGGVFLIFQGGTPTVVLEDPGAASKALKANLNRQRFHVLESGEEHKETFMGLVLLRGDAWREARNLWQPFFHRQSLAGHGALMAVSAERLAGALGAAADSGAVVDIWRSFGALTFDVVGTTAFGVNFDTLARLEGGDDTASTKAGSGKGESTIKSAAAEKLVAAARTAFAVGGVANWPVLFQFLFPHFDAPLRVLTSRIPTPLRRQDLEAKATLRSVTAELVDLAREGGGAESVAKALEGPRPAGVDPGSFLALLSRKPHSQSWIAAQTRTFILAGYETTASALAYCVYCLALNPRAEAALLAEVDAWGQGKAPTVDDLASSFPFVDACIKEALRLYPPATLASREAKEDLWLGGHHVPAGTSLHVSIYGLHRSERHWRQPLDFVPERWVAGTPESEWGDTKEAWMAFGEGARKCVAARFALLEATLALVRLYQQFTFRLTPGQVPLKVKTLITMGPANGVKVTVHRR